MSTQIITPTMGVAVPASSLNSMTEPSEISKVVPVVNCSLCILNAVSRLSLQSVTSASKSAFVLFYTDYSITSEMVTQGTCRITSGKPQSLVTPFSYVLSDDSSDAFGSGLDSFADFLGLTTDCVSGQRGARRTSSSLAISKLTGVETSSSALPTSSSLASSKKTGEEISSSPFPAIPRTTPHHRVVPLTEDLKIMIGIVVPISVLIFMLSVFGIIRRNAKLRKLQEAQTRENQAKGENLPGGEEESTPPFLQRKAELQGEDSRYEVHGLDVRHELPGSMDRQEAPGDDSALEAPGECGSAEVNRPP